MKTITPAMTAQEWAKLETREGEFGDYGVVFIEPAGGEVRCAAGGAACAVAHPHGAAALCLHGQPFGFTREDVRLLERLRARTDEGEDAIGHLADRIEALLPPMEPAA